MKTTWLYPANPSEYDVIKAFKDLKKIDWGIPNNVENGDIVYIYLGNDIRKIMIKSEVIDNNVSKDDLIDDTDYILKNKEADNSSNDDKASYVRLKMIECFDKDENTLLGYEALRKNGLNCSIRSGLNLGNNEILKEYIEKQENKMINCRKEKLKISQVLSNDDLMYIFRCSNSSGMRRSHKTNTLCIISDHTKSLYEDRWVDDLFHYTGMGQTGDQSLKYAQNKVLYESNSTAIEIHLFEVFEEGKYIYEGQVKLIEEPYEEEQEDIDGNLRKVWVFPLKKVKEEQLLIPEEAIKNKEKNKEKEAKKLDDKKLKELAKKASRNSGTRTTISTTYDRNAYVSEYAKRRAKGICQLCNQPAPFENKKGEAYLETHHIEWLSKGGEDSIENTVALCPNCHKKMHVLDLQSDRDILYKVIRG